MTNQQMLIFKFHVFLCFVDRASRNVRVTKPTWRTIYLFSVYLVAIPLRVSALLVAHQQEVTVYKCDSWYVLYVLVDCRLAWTACRKSTNTYNQCFFFLGGRRGTRTPKYFVNLAGESKNFKMLAFPLNHLQTYYGYLCDLLSFM
jgi:hypothetical protein